MRWYRQCCSAAYHCLHCTLSTSYQVQRCYSGDKLPSTPALYSTVQGLYCRHCALCRSFSAAVGCILTSASFCQPLDSERRLGKLPQAGSTRTSGGCFGGGGMVVRPQSSWKAHEVNHAYSRGRLKPGTRPERRVVPVVNKHNCQNGHFVLLQMDLFVV